MNRAIINMVGLRPAWLISADAMDISASVPVEPEQRAPALHFDWAPTGRYNGRGTGESRLPGGEFLLLTVVCPRPLPQAAPGYPCAYSSVDRASVFETGGRGFESL